MKTRHIEARNDHRSRARAIEAEDRREGNENGEKQGTERREEKERQGNGNSRTNETREPGKLAASEQRGNRMREEAE